LNNIETILLGVFVGVLTALLLFVCKQFWVSILVPFWQKIRYRGADISGAWTADFIDEENKTQTKLSLVLYQSAHNIKGSMYFTNKTPEYDEQIEFCLSGTYWETFLSISAKSKSRKTFSGGVMYLKSKRNGAEFDGNFSFRDAGTDSVTNLPIQFIRT
jgi:hypothetical protein